MTLSTRSAGTEINDGTVSYTDRMQLTQIGMTCATLTTEGNWGEWKDKE